MSVLSEDLFKCRPLLGGSVATGIAVGLSDIDVGILLSPEEQQKHKRLFLQQPRPLLRLHPWAVWPAVTAAATAAVPALITG